MMSIVYGPKWPFYSCWDYITLFGTGVCRFCIWVELPVQRRLCPIFVKNIGSPDIHEYSTGLRVVNGLPGFGVSQLGIRAQVYEYLGSSGLGIHHHLGGLMFGLGMKLPMKAQNKTRTLHVCFVCALIHWLFEWCV